MQYEAVIISNLYFLQTSSEMQYWCGGRGVLEKLSLCYSTVYNYNVAQRCEQFLHVDRLYRALISFGLALSSERFYIFGPYAAVYIY